MVFCQSSKSSYLEVQGYQGSAKLLKCYVWFSKRSATFVQISKGFCDLRMTRSYHCHVFHWAELCPTEPLRLDSPKFVKASLTSLDFSLSWEDTPSNLASNGVFSGCVISVNFYPWIHSRFSICLHMTSGWAWGGGDRILFGHEPQHWHILASPLILHPPNPRASWAHPLCVRVCRGERRLWVWYSSYRLTRTQQSTTTTPQSRKHIFVNVY